MVNYSTKFKIRAYDLQEASTRNASSEPVGVEVLLDSDGQGELDLGVVELLHMWSSALVGLDFLHTDNLDGVGTSTVASTHVAVCKKGSI